MDTNILLSNSMIMMTGLTLDGIDMNLNRSRSDLDLGRRKNATHLLLDSV